MERMNDPSIYRILMGYTIVLSLTHSLTHSLSLSLYSIRCIRIMMLHALTPWRCMVSSYSYE